MANVDPKASKARQKKPAAYTFQVVIEADEDGFHAFPPALKGCHTWGKTYEEALSNIQEAMRCHLLAMLDLGDTIPQEQFSEPATLTVTLTL
ncbi:MAG: type II toxin-antitoxin system HicB family antitoxin [Deinococcus sp.]|nr:type II toxin-antitoxin system HicB family antitoxin [Deinococcus sp.]